MTTNFYSGTNGKTFSLVIDISSNGLPKIIINHHGLVCEVYFYAGFENICKINLEQDYVYYEYKSPYSLESSICWNRKENYARFIVDYLGENKNNKSFGGCADLTIPLTPETYEELLDVFRELQKYLSNGF